jgi:outer membrane lipoprotein carrier protein
MSKIKLIGLFYLWCLPFLGFSQDDDFTPISNPLSVTQALAEESAISHTLTCSFVQEKHLEMLEEVLVSRGKFLFKQENSVRWEYTEPIRYTILIHHGKFTIDNDGKVSQFNTDSNPMFREINKMIITAIRGDFVGNTDFAPSYFENSTQYKVRLIPSAEQVRNMIEGISIYFDKVTLQVVKVIFSEPGGDYTSIGFFNILTNIEIQDSQFTQE